MSHSNLCDTALTALTFDLSKGSMTEPERRNNDVTAKMYSTKETCPARHPITSPSMSGQLISNRAGRHHKLIHHISYTIGFRAFDPFCSTHPTPLLDRRGSRAPGDGSPKPPPCQPSPSRPALLTEVSERTAFPSQEAGLRQLIDGADPSGTTGSPPQPSMIRPPKSSSALQETSKNPNADGSVKNHGWSSTPGAAAREAGPRSAAG